MPVAGLVPAQRTVRCSTLSSRARRLTAFASSTEPGRRPCSTVTATSFGPRFNRARQRAASQSSAVESGPPETARTMAALGARSANSAAASADRTGRSAAGTLLFPLDALLHGRRQAGILAPDLDEGGAGGLLLLERRERLAEPQQGVGRLAGFLELGRDVEEGLGGIPVALALEQALAEPIMRLRREAIGRILAHEGAEALLRQRIVLAHQVAVGEVVLVPRRRARRKHGLLLRGAGRARIARGR